MVCVLLTGCGDKNVNEVTYNDSVDVEEEKMPEVMPIEDEIVNESQNYDDEIIDIDDEYIFDDEIIEWDDIDNEPYEEEKVVVDEVINCDGCVYAYFSDEGDKAKTLGSTLSSVSAFRSSSIISALAPNPPVPRTIGRSRTRGRIPS